MRRLPTKSLPLAAILTACTLSSCQAPPPPPEPTPEVTPEPEPPPPPPPLISPDGVTMLSCPDNIPDDSACIPGGAFTRGYDGEHDCDQSENKREQTHFGPAQAVWVQTFLMDKNEVTYGEYQACVTAKKCNPAGPLYRDYDRPNQPMMGANWFDAQKFCHAHGKRLPTEAEWEKAARGPDGHPTPFGAGPSTCETAVIQDESGRSCGVKKKGSQPHKGRVLEVGSRAAGVYGLFDMVGNAEEWVDDWFVSSVKRCGDECQGTSPKGPCAGEESCKSSRLKMVKGGSWYWDAGHATGWHRRPHVPNNKPYHHFGFRCATAIQPPGSP